MASSNPPRRLAAALAVVATACLTLALAPAAQATPGANPGPPSTGSPTSASGTPTIAEVSAHLGELGHQIEQLSEKLNQAGEDVKAKQRQAAAARVAAVKAAVVYAKASDAIKMLISDRYKTSGLGRTTAILSSTSTQDYLDRLTALRLLNDRRTAVAAQLMTARSQAQTTAATAKQLVSEAQTQQSALRTQRDSVQTQQDKYQALLDRLTAAQRAAYFARVNPVAPAKTKHTAVSNVPAKAPSNAAAVAVQYALAQQGKPYVFAASGPDAFDCSGLTAAAWEHAGVSIPHFAATQYDYGQHVSRDQLAPGDLVFFYSPIGHVAIYIGNGLIVHAPTPGDVVKVVPLSTFNSDYVGATRL